MLRHSDRKDFLCSTCGKQFKVIHICPDEEHACRSAVTYTHINAVLCDVNALVFEPKYICCIYSLDMKFAVECFSHSFHCVFFNYYNFFG